MKKIISLFMLIMLFSVYSYAKGIKVTCFSNGSTNITYIAVKGKWIGFSAKTNSGRIIDEPPKKVSITKTGGENINFPSGISAVRSSTWKAYKNGSMQTRYNDSGWVSCK